jgi:hypothetical protein
MEESWIIADQQRSHQAEEDEEGLEEDEKQEKEWERTCAVAAAPSAVGDDRRKSDSAEIREPTATSIGLYLNKSHQTQGDAS